MAQDDWREVRRLLPKALLTTIFVLALFVGLFAAWGPDAAILGLVVYGLADWLFDPLGYRKKPD
ncbi:MAG: hypothetical protein QM698_06185 [Micropepsaceae bacterium]